MRDMPGRARKAPQKQKRHHFLKEWREYLDITQERAMERLGWSQSKISRIENYKIQLTTDDLAAAAWAYAVSEFDLLNVDPNKEGDVIDIMGRLPSSSPEQRKQVADYAAFVLGKKEAG